MNSILLEERLKQAISEKVFPGCALGIISNEKVNILTFGKFTYDDSSPLVRESSLFDLASVTKSVCTNTLALMLMEKDVISLDEKVVDILPDFKIKNQVELKNDLLIRHLLTYRVLLDYGGGMATYKEIPADDIKKKLLNPIVIGEPGEIYDYGNPIAIITGMILEKVTGNPLDVLFEEYIAGPLGMTGSAFKPLEKFSLDDIVPTEICPWRNTLLHGVVHDEGSYALSPIMLSGAAGLFTTVKDLISFSMMILNNGSFLGKQILKNQTIKEMYKNQLLGIKNMEKESNMGLGWQIKQPWYMSELCSDKTIGMTGFTGCSVVIDLENQNAIILLANPIYPHRRENSKLINEVRSDIAALVFGGNKER